MGLNKSEITDLSLYLQQLPDIEDVRLRSAQETVTELIRDITALQKRGYTIEQISVALATGGFEILPEKLKSYMQRARKSAGVKQKKKPARPQASSPESPSPVI